MAKYYVEFKKKVVAYYYIHGQVATLSKFKSIAKETLRRWIWKKEPVGFMRKANKILSGEQKLKVLRYFWEHGNAETDREYGINAGTIHNWERKYREYGVEGLSYDGRGKKVVRKPKDISKGNYLLDELFKLRLENEYLKKLDALVQEREERERKKKQE